MTQSIYIRPTLLVSGPQSVEGDAIRLAGGLVYAHGFALVVREDGRVVSNDRVTARGMERALSQLPESLLEEANRQWADLRKVHRPLECGERTIRLDQPQVMGILNMTPDSFSDGGEFLGDPQAAGAHAAAMLEAGAAIIDIGGESTRPGAAEVWEGDEIKRVIPAVEAVAAMGAAISVDTRRPAVMEAALEAGAHIVNDVSALRYDPRSIDLVSSAHVPVILMHAPGDGQDLHAEGNYRNVAYDVFDALQAMRNLAVDAGIDRDLIVLDPGIGFGKSLADNLALMNALPLFHALGQPLLVGASRKRMIGALSNEAPAHLRVGGSIALATKAMEAGAQLLRVHDVPETVQARNVWRGLRDSALTDFGDLPG